jgi:hypothetical protein
MDRTRIPIRQIKIKFKGERPMELPRAKLFSNVLGDSNTRGDDWQEIGKEALSEDRKNWRLFLHRPL